MCCWPKLECRSSDSKYSRLSISSHSLQKYARNAECSYETKMISQMMMGCSSHTRPFPVWPHPGKFSARASSLRSSKRSPSSLSNASSQLCKAQGKKFHPDRSRQSPYALKHEVWLPLSQFIIKSKNVAMNTGSGLHLWNDIGQSAEISESPFSFLISAHTVKIFCKLGGKKKPLLLWADFITFFTLSWASQEASDL